MPEVLFFEWYGVELPLLGEFWEYFLFDHAEPLWNSSDNFTAEQVNPRIDLITNEVLRFLNKALDFALRTRYDHSETARVLDCSQYDCGLLLVAFVEVQEFLEWVVADNVAVEYEQKRVFASFLDDGFSKFDGASSPQRLFLL
jgi:hypothetical protein